MADKARLKHVIKALWEKSLILNENNADQIKAIFLVKLLFRESIGSRFEGILTLEQMRLGAPRTYWFRRFRSYNMYVMCKQSVQ